MKAEKNAQAADDGDDARNRHQNVGDRHPLRGGIGHLLMRKVAEAASNKNQRIEQTSQGDKVAHGSISVFKLRLNKTLRSPRAWSDRNRSFDPLDCGCLGSYRQIRFSLIFGVYESDVGQPDKPENVTQVRLLKIELCIRRAGRIGAASRSDHINLLARHESFWSGFSVRNRLAKTHNLVKPSLEAR